MSEELNIRHRTPKHEMILKRLPEEDYVLLTKKLEKLDKTRKRVNYLATKFKLSRTTARKFYTEHFEPKLVPVTATESSSLPVQGGEHEYYDNFYISQKLFFYAAKKKTQEQVHVLLSTLLLRVQDLRAIFRAITGQVATTDKYQLLHDGIVGALFDMSPEKVQLCTTDQPYRSQRSYDEENENDNQDNNQPKRKRGRPALPKPPEPVQVVLNLDGETITLGADK